MEPKKNNDPGTWQTGRIVPPKRHSALISILLVLVILLCGISTALSILNFKLHKELTLPQKIPTVSFSRGAELPDTAADYPEDLQLAGFGIQGTVIPRVYQRYYKLPSGIYVTQVSSDSEAFTKGIVVGDIITGIEGVTIGDELTPEQLPFTPGQEVTLHLYRNGMESTLFLVWEN